MERKIVVGFDIETPKAEQLYTGGYEGPFVRLVGTIDDYPSRVGDSSTMAYFLRALEQADVIYGHNILRFDLPALAYHCGADYDALAAKAIDTMVLARLADPPGAKHVTKAGYYGLDEVAHRLGHEGKTDDLKALAKEFGGFDRIPVDDPRYVAYLHGDLGATKFVYDVLTADGLSDYARLEMRKVAFQNRITLNGWRVDLPLLSDRVAEEDGKRRSAIEVLGRDYAVPLVKKDGKPSLSPWATEGGREALTAAFQGAGAQYVPRTKTGALAIGKEPMGSGHWVNSEGKRVPGMLHPDAYGKLPAVRELCAVLATATGATAKYAEIQNHLVGDRVHAGIGEDQASGRWAMTKPSLTNLGKRGEKIQQRAPFIFEPGHVGLTCDLSQVDMRAIAALSQDVAYMELFAPGRDAHTEMAAVYFGSPSKENRDRTKPINHGLNYGQSDRMIAARTGLDIGLVSLASSRRAQAYPRVLEWTEEVREIGASGQLLDNGFGRLMRCEPERAYTQAPALMGQGAARDIMCTAILRLIDMADRFGKNVLPYLRGVVHDEVIVSVPEEEADAWATLLKRAFTFEWRDVPILCEVGVPSKSWDGCYAGE